MSNTEHENFWARRKDVKSGQSIAIWHPESGAVIRVKLTGTGRWVNLPGDIPVDPLDKFLSRGWKVLD